MKIDFFNDFSYIVVHYKRFNTLKTHNHEYKINFYSTNAF